MYTLKSLVISIAVAGSLAFSACAKENTPPAAHQSVTLKPRLGTTKKYEGTLASKKIVLLLSAWGNDYSGGYAYITPNQASGQLRWIDVAGKKNPDGTTSLAERLNGKATGQFKGKISGRDFAGAWTSPNGKRFDFSVAEENIGNPTFVAEVTGADDAKKIAKISVYKDGKLSQSIPANIEISSTADSLTYETSDYNFDGYPDFYLSGDDQGQIYLLFDSETNNYVVAPATLQAIKVTSSEYSTKQLFEEWSASGGVGANTYQFVNNKYCLIEETVVSGPAETAKTTKKSYPVSQCRGKKN